MTEIANPSPAPTEPGDIVAFLERCIDSCDALGGEGLPEGSMKTGAWQIEAYACMGKSERAMCQAADTITTLRTDLKATRCPIGQDDAHDFCSAGSCYRCLGERLDALRTENQTAMSEIAKLLAENERMRDGLRKIQRRAEPTPYDELSDAQRDLRHIAATAGAFLNGGDNG